MIKEPGTETLSLAEGYLVVEVSDGIEEGVTFGLDEAGLDLVWNFNTTAGVFTQTAVTPADGGAGTDYDWVEQGDGMESIVIEE